MTFIVELSSIKTLLSSDTILHFLCCSLLRWIVACYIFGNSVISFIYVCLNSPWSCHAYVILKWWSCYSILRYIALSQIAKFMGPTWGPPGSCRPQMGLCWPHEPCYRGYYMLYSQLQLQNTDKTECTQQPPNEVTWWASCGLSVYCDRFQGN